MIAGFQRERTQKRAGWQFSLRTIFLLTFAAATLAAVARVAAQLDVLVLGIAAPIWSAHAAARSWRTRRRLSVITIGHLVVAWCVLYLVSVGPSCLLAGRYQWTEPLLERFYAPLDWLFDHEPLYGPLHWYVSFWWGLMFR